MIKLTDEEYEEINDILNGYVIELGEINKNTEEYSNLKRKLDNKFCGLNILQEQQILWAELDIGNVMIEDDLLTYIYNNSLHRYKMLKRKAKNGEFVYIINATDCTPFNKKYIGRCFQVHKQPTKEELEWVCDHVVVNIEGLDVGWCLYDDQYVVLEEI